MTDKKQHNFIENGTFVVGLLILLALISYLVYQISQDKKSPPEIQVTTNYQPAMDNYAFEVTVENNGGESAEAVNIKLSLYQEGEAVEDGTLDIQYVPVKSKETGWIVFHSERKAGDSLVVSSVTYMKP